MIEVDAENVLSYLESRQSELADWPEFGNEELAQAVAAELAWGVSNIVLRVDTPARSFVVKQSRKQLRTPIDWCSQLERVWREVDTMQALEGLLPAGAVPRVLFQDRENYLFAMEAVEAVADPCKRRIEVSTEQAQDEILIAVGNSGAPIHEGMGISRAQFTGLDGLGVCAGTDRIFAGE